MDHQLKSFSLGAVKAITRKEKGSLFSVGIKKVEGVFNAQQCVDIVLYEESSNGSGTLADSETRRGSVDSESSAPKIAKNNKVGRGIVNYSSAEISRIKGIKSKDINNILGYIETEFVIHRDNIALWGV